MSDTRVIAGMRVFGLNVPNSISSVHSIELSPDAKRRLKAIQWYESHGRNARLTSRHFGISADTFHRWKRRYDEGGPAALEDNSRRPRSVRRPTWSREFERAVRELRETTGWGKDKLVVLLRREGWHCSTSMVGRVLKKLRDSGTLVEAPLSDPWKRPRPFRRPYGVRKPKDYVPKAPGDIIQVDTAYIHLPTGFRFKHFTACDVFTRIQVLEVHSRATAHAAAGFLDTVTQRLPFPIKAIQVDGGSEFMAQFEYACKERGIRLFVLPPRSPKLNGHVERAQRTHREEFYQRHLLPDSVTKINKMLKTWEGVHNRYRPHQALNYLTPFAFYKSIKKGAKVSDM